MLQQDLLTRPQSLPFRGVVCTSSCAIPPGDRVRATAHREWCDSCEVDPEMMTFDAVYAELRREPHNAWQLIHIRLEESELEGHTTPVPARCGNLVPHANELSDVPDNFLPPDALHDRFRRLAPGAV